MSQQPVGFDDILAPLSRQQFLADYWGQKFCHLMGAKGRFTLLLSWEALNTILEWHSPPQPQVRLFQENKMVDVRRYIDGAVGSLRLNAGGLIAALSQGASLIMDGVQDVAPPLASLIQSIEQATDGIAFANVYAGWQPQKAFDLHWDPHEVIVMQLSGRKHWKVYGQTHPHPMMEDFEKLPPPTGQPVFDAVLNDGDMLYLPRGWWHMAIPLDEPSLHLSIGVEPPTGADFLQWLNARMLRHAGMRQILPPAGEASARQDYLDRVKKLLESETAGDAVGEFLRQRRAGRRMRPHLRLPHAPLEQLQQTTMATRFRLAATDHLFIEFAPGDGLAKFKAGGVDYSFAPDLIPALQKLSGRAALPLSELSAGITNPQLIGMLVGALDMLAGAGLVFKESPAASRANSVRGRPE